MNKKVIFSLLISLFLSIGVYVASYTPLYACCGGCNTCCQQNTPYDCGGPCTPCTCGGCPPPCTPGPCAGCTPSCSTGQTTTVTGPLCVVGTTSSCTGSNGCGGACTLTGGACYYNETNTTFIQSNGSTSGPTSITITVDGTTYTLSTNPDNPTQIKLPASGSSNVQISTPTFTAPTTSRGANYYYQVNNYGTNDEWKTWTTCSGVAGEDFCTTMPNSNNTQSFVPTSKTVNQVLKENATGKISAMYATTDKCNNTYKYSLPREGYYVVDTIPDQQPITFDLDTTFRGCSSTTYTGREVNNPLNIVARATDDNTNNEVKASVIWFSKDTTVPTTASIGNSCDTGYYVVAGNKCCPNNTTYSDGDCVSSTTPASTEYFSATGGTISYSGQYTIHKFTSNGTFTVSSPISVDALVVGGGGGGGNNTGGLAGAGGGGAGGYIYQTSFPIAANSYAVTIGGGGAASTNGANSSFSTLIAYGGGAGGDSNYGWGEGGSNGGSGGGAGWPGYYTLATYYGGTGSQGYNGGYSIGGPGQGNGGGGGGAGAAGVNATPLPGNGGVGLANSITGTSVYYAGGGGGGAYNGIGGTGGLGGGGNGGGPGAAVATNGAPNTGGGGGGSGYALWVALAGSGGSGIVVIRYTTPTPNRCETGYYLAATSVCCPDNTTYSGGQCTSIPTTVGEIFSESDISDLGIMIYEDGTIYTTNTSQNWTLLSNEYIRANGEDIIRVYDVSIEKGEEVTFDYKLEFLPSDENLSGMYNVYGTTLDTYMVNSSKVDLSYMPKLFNWGFDFENPTVNDIQQQVQNPTNTELTWGVSDTVSSIDKVVMNGYRRGGTQTDRVSLLLPTAYTTNKGYITLNSIPDSEEIGLYDETNAWIFDNSTGETDLLNIGNNEDGKIDIYVTAYDLACNTNTITEEIDLDPWFATRGGTVYSRGNITTGAKNVSAVETLNGVFNIKTQMTKEVIDTGTELLSTRNLNISNLIHSDSGAIRSLVMYDSNNSKNYWFYTLMDGFEKYRNNSTQIDQLTTSVSADCEGEGSCYYISTSDEEDVSIPSGYVCDRPTLIVSNRDMYIEPNIESAGNFSGCIFLAKNDIHIGAGDYQSSGSQVGYDYLEGFLIAENKILIDNVDQFLSPRDGLEILGGLVAFGSNITDNSQAISIDRSMKLFTQTNPTLVVTYDNRYTSISTIYFGQQAIVQRQEIGFKSY